MRRWERFDERSREMDLARIERMTLAERANEAWRLFYELTASYSPQELDEELERRRQERIEQHRARRRA